MADVASPPRSGAGFGSFSPLASLVRVAMEEDDPARLVEAAAVEVGLPLAVAALNGQAIAHAPDDALGREALEIARAAARRSGALPPPGWCVLPVSYGRSRRAVLAVRADPGDPTTGPQLDLVVALLGEQLFRAALRRSQIAGFLRRLVSERAPERIHEEAAAVGLTLADAYWPVVVAPALGALKPGDVECIDREARRLAPGTLTVAARGCVVLLMPASDPVAGGEPADLDAMAWLELVVARIRDLVPPLDMRAIAGDDAVSLVELGALVGRLVRLTAYGQGAQSDAYVTRARQYALAGFLRDSVAAGQARAFVDDLLGDLVAWDAEHGSDLVRVLEAALDSPRQDVAARRCFMHRNTFRHRYHKALEVLGDDLEDPEMRLAVHVALKLHRGTAA